MPSENNLINGHNTLLFKQSTNKHLSNINNIRKITFTNSTMHLKKKTIKIKSTISHPHQSADISDPTKMHTHYTKAVILTHNVI